MVLFASIVPTSCNKDTIRYDFDGQITGSLTDVPISGVDITISQKIVQNGTTADGHSFAGSDVTGANGQFSISFDREMVTEFLLEFEKDNYFPLEILESSANVTTDGLNTYNEKLEPQSWVKFDIENTWPMATDHFKFIIHNFREGCQDCAENSLREFYGTLDTVFTYVTTAGEYARFTYINVTSGMSHTDSIYTTPFDTTTYTITY